MVQGCAFDPLQLFFFLIQAGTNRIMHVLRSLRANPNNFSLFTQEYCC
jgi:hypothetical protein